MAVQGWATCDWTGQAKKGAWTLAAPPPQPPTLHPTLEVLRLGSLDHGVGRGVMNAGLCPVRGRHIPPEPLCCAQQSGGEGRAAEDTAGEAWRGNAEQIRIDEPATRRSCRRYTRSPGNLCSGSNSW